MTSCPACGSVTTGVPFESAAVMSEPYASDSSGPPPLTLTGAAQLEPPSLEVIPQTLLTFEGEMAPKIASSVPSGRRTRPGWPACHPESAVTCALALPVGLIEIAPRPFRVLPANVW